jgi:peptidoglycan-N-acetylglucosamine deacetylase
VSGLWPDDIRCVVMLTIDVDGVASLMNRFPQAPEHPTLMSLGEFGPLVGTPRILDILDKRNIKASVFIPGYVAEQHPDLVRDVVQRGHELGHHGYLHEPPATISAQQEAEILDKGIAILEGLSGCRPVGYRAPAWELSAHTLTLLAEREFVYDSSLVGGDVPYLVNTGNRQLLELPVQWFLDDHPYFVFLPEMGRMGRLPGVEEVFENWRAEFEGVYRYGRALMLTLHDRQSGRLGKIVALERLIDFMRSFPGVEFMTCSGTASLWRQKHG